MCQEQRILTTRTEHVEGDIALSCEPAPVSNKKRFGKAHHTGKRKARHAGKKMIFSGAYGPFGGVCAMDVSWSVLDACLFGGNKRFNFFECFAVEFMQERFEAAESEPEEDLAICMEKFFF